MLLARHCAPDHDRRRQRRSTPSSAVGRSRRIAAADKAVFIRGHAEPFLKAIDHINAGAIALFPTWAKPVHPAQRVLGVGQRRNLASPGTLADIANAGGLNVHNRKALSQHRPTGRQDLSLELLSTPHRAHDQPPGACSVKRAQRNHLRSHAHRLCRPMRLSQKSHWVVKSQSPPRAGTRSGGTEYLVVGVSWREGAGPRVKEAFDYFAPPRRGSCRGATEGVLPARVPDGTWWSRTPSAFGTSPCRGRKGIMQRSP